MGRITRRHVLAATSAMAAVGALGAVGIGWRWWDRPAGAGHHVLSDDEHAFTQALAEAWMPPGGQPAISGSEAQMGDFLDDVIQVMAPTQGRLFRVLLHLLDDETVPTHGACFRHLDLPTRTAVLAGWMGSPWYLQRQAVGGVMALLSFGYSEHPEVAAGLRPYFRCGFGR